MMKDFAQIKPKWIFRRYASQADFERGEAYDESEVVGNLLLNEGIALLQSLLIGGGGTPYSNANARIGVGDDNTAASAAQTGLQASTNKTWVAVESGYPDVTDQTTTWRAIFDGDTGNFDWREFTVVNAANDAGDNLNRLVSSQGTKASGQVWTIDVEITWS